MGYADTDRAIKLRRSTTPSFIGVDMKRFSTLQVLVLFSLLSIFPVAAHAGDKPGVLASESWQFLSDVPPQRAAGRPWVRPDHFQPVVLDLDAMKGSLRDVPMEVVGSGARSSGFIVELPMPDGSLAAFKVVESPIMEPGLAEKFPEIKTYLGQGIDDPTATVRFDVTPQGFHSQVLSPRGAAYIDPYTFGDTEFYACYWARDQRPQENFECLTSDEELMDAAIESLQTAAPRTSGATLRTFRVAVAATGEYTAFHGGTVPLAQAAIVTAVNRITGIYELEVTVRLVLVANNDLLVFTDGLTDPYSNGSPSTMLGQNQTTITNVIGTANYDIGHVFGTIAGGYSGVASGTVCTSTTKARGVSTHQSPTGDGFAVQLVSHEMGHQFSASHTWNGVGGSCASAGQWQSASAFERGSGSTIMSYAGACGATDNMQNGSDPYFHSRSHEQILSFITPLSCDVETATGNTVPTVEAGVNYTIPSFTPFTLTAVGSDGDGDTVLYTWEERDLGPQQAANLADNGTSPLFRAREATTDPTRTCPLLTLLLADNFIAKGERMPVTTRTLNWRCTVRDNRAGGGGVFSDSMAISVTSAGGSFGVTSPNTAVSWSGNQTVTWTVAGTDGAPVNCANVNILLSTDGGNTFPTLLVGSTPNDGSQSVTLPNINTVTARIKVESVGNIFFDISAANFTITPGTPDPPTGVSASPPAVCSGGACNLNATVGGGEDVDWYTGGCGVGGGGTLAGTGSPLGVNPVATTTYYAQARNIGSGLLSTCTTVTVVVPGLGDANGSGLVEITDVGPFVDGIVTGVSALPCALDMNSDTFLDGVDIVLFTNTLAP
jgi:hypothetical protein